MRPEDGGCWTITRPAPMRCRASGEVRLLTASPKRRLRRLHALRFVLTERALSASLRKWREAKSRPVQGNSPNDRILRGPGCHRHKRVCVDFFPATPRPQLPGNAEASRSAFLRHAESIGPMWPLQAGAGVPPPVGRLRGPANGRDGRSAPCSSSAMSSGRLFLDRVARQQSPSPLHRQPDHKTIDRWEGRNYHRTVTASFPPCLTEGVHPTIRVNSCPSVAIIFLHTF
jgi:hypothetical protein